MDKKLYIELWESKVTGYVKVERMFFENDLVEKYKDMVISLTKFNSNMRTECIEGFKLQHILINVKFDGRKGVMENDVMKSLEKQGLIKKVAEGGVFGDYYQKTEKLTSIMNDQLSKRKELAGVA